MSEGSLWHRSRLEGKSRGGLRWDRHRRLGWSIEARPADKALSCPRVTPSSPELGQELPLAGAELNDERHTQRHRAAECHPGHIDSIERMIIWLNGTHGSGKTTTAPLVQQLVPDSRVFDAEKVGETLMDISPGLPSTDNFQHWPPWRPLVVETARRVLEYTGGTLVMPMTVLVEPYWREISQGFDSYGIPVQHFVLHADQETLRRRIQDDAVMGPSSFRFSYLSSYSEALDGWLGQDAHVIDTAQLTPHQTASRIATSVTGDTAVR